MSEIKKVGINRVLIKPDTVEDTGGVIIPHHLAASRMAGTVVHVGVMLGSPLPVEVGEHWNYDPSRAIYIKSGGDEYAVLSVHDLLFCEE